MMPDKILIRTPNWLGDLMMSTAFIQAVLNHYKSIQVDLIVRKGFESIPLPHRGKIIVYDKKQTSLFQFAREIKFNKYDQIFVLPPSFSSAFMACWSRIPKRTGYPGDGRRIWLNDQKQYKTPHRTQHLISEYLQMLEPSPNRPYFPHLPVDGKWISTQIKLSGLNLPRNFITIAPGAKYGPAKMWPMQSYQKLVELLSDKGIPSVILGTEDERKLGEAITAKSKQVSNLCGKTSLLEMIAVMAKSKLLVSNDSGTMHVMSALAKPQIALFGSTSTVWTGPVNPLAEVITVNYKCSPCFKRTCKYQHYECLTGISPERVLGSILKIVNNEIR